MTKLGAQPGVHGSEDVEKESIKIDPKVFTVLQPTVIPMPAPPMKPAPSPAFQAMRACFHCMFFATCLLLVTLIGFYFLAATPDLFKKTETSVNKPQMEALLAQPIDGSSEKTINSAENPGMMAIPLARVVVVEDISNNEGQKKTTVDGSVEEKSSTNLDRPLHPDEIEQYRMMEARQQFQQIMEERMYMQQMMAMRMMRMRRLQAAYYQQQQMKMAYMQQQQQQMQEEAARQQWAERSRYEEEQRRQYEAQQTYAQQQRAQAFWQQHQLEMQAQTQQAQAQAQWQQQEQQPQEQQRQRFWPRPMMHQQQWERPTVWQQPPQQFFFPSQQQQQHQQQPQQTQQPEDRFPQAPQFFQPIPQPSVHDKIYEELQKKSQNIPVNAPTRQIWTAITPTPAPEAASGTADVTASPINTAFPAVVTSSTPMPEDAAEVSDTILRDIFSAFDEQKNSEAANKELNSATPSTTEEPELEGKGAIVIEDSFPRIEERTTTPEPMESEEDAEHTSSEDNHEKELDPFAAVLKFFENNPPREALEAAGAETAATTQKPLKPLIV
ncbi:uncharacterized protein CELE_Y79H2A.1 [Caenorhabditis elegans]|nr:uncharacterized protein CELE_Y79H2A.1 [Caenorhabditis elegans]CAB54505.1 Bypass of Response to Pheromone in yeast [Caenorhabditis elegans]|eukprot:NP_001022951.1 Bypass of Response to Pheromone in yeast [Caenorhabditis elegans]